MQIHVRTYEVPDKNSVGELISAIQRGEFGLPITLEQQPDLMDIENFYQTGAGNFWVACDDTRVVGTISLKDIGENCVALRKMFVHPDYRGKDKGISATLLSTALEWGRAKKLTAVYLGTTPQFLAAHRFYEKSGFEEIPANDLPVSFPIMHVDKKFYRYSY